MPSTIPLLKVKNRGQDNLVQRFFIMTVDVDGWSSLLKFYSVEHDPLDAALQVSVEEGVLKLLNLFKMHQIKATFFVAGKIAQQYPSLIKKICHYGHEVACHGLTHDKNEFLRDEMNQRRNLEEATRIIEEISGTRPKGFRAPCLRANETTMAILEEYGYLYDSSVLPSFVPGYYGSLGAPLRPYHPSDLSIEKEGSYNILEIPISINPVIRLPLSAAWMRNLGLTWVKFGIKMNFVLSNPVVFYVHPRDVVSLPKVKGVPWHVYRNVGDSSLRTLSQIIRYGKRLGAKFITAEDFIKEWSACDNNKT